VSNPKPFNLRCPNCNWFLVEVEKLFVTSLDESSKAEVTLRIKCPNCKKNCRRTVEATLPKFEVKK